MTQDRSLKMFALRLAGAALLVGLVHAGARIVRFLYQPPQTNLCFDGIYDAQYSLYFYFEDCTPPRGFWAEFWSYSPGTLDEFIVQHVVSIALLAGAAGVTSMLFGGLYLLVTGTWPHNEEEETTLPQCVHATHEGEPEAVPYCRNSECSCVEHEDEEFTAVWIPRQD